MTLNAAMAIASVLLAPAASARSHARGLPALKRGGRDVPSNMQWQSVREAKAKDRSE